MTNRPVLVTCFASTLLTACGGTPRDIPPNDVIPTPQQLAYQQQEFIGFLHFSVNTFTDREWGFGDESPQVFDPAELDTHQWASVAAEVGMGELILTAKHHDGFCLWPSRYTEHSVASSPWRDGSGDVVRDLFAAAAAYGVKVGLYLSPWDRNHAAYGTSAYVDYYRDQLRELMTDYGVVTEIWVDGANGGTGFYGGANEERRIDRTTYYEWDETFALIKSLQPHTLIFSDAGPDIRWIGNEHGYAGETNWSMLNTDEVVIGAADAAYLNSGDPQGRDWVVPLCNTSIRPGWFYHPEEDDDVKSLDELLEVYYKSVGRNCVLLLNVPPDRRGLLHEQDVAVLREFRRVLDATFAVNLAGGASATADSHRQEHEYFSPANVVDDDPASYWAAEDGVRHAVLEIDLGGAMRFDRILLQEPIRFGQRISRFAVQARVDGEWSTVAEATTIGYKRILRVDTVEADAVRIVIEGANNVPALSNVGLFKVPAS
ncbi:MAG: alpha-L-fucosidase [Gemmatimonadales bacterium]|jgi:alpha-L-fucosidase